MKNIINIPNYVINWTDGYFHQSAFDIPLKYPTQKIITFLSLFKKPSKIKLYRGVNKYNQDNDIITSWTHDKQIAKRYAQEARGKVVEKEFLACQILLDTTMLTDTEKLQLGYDYKVDDKEVLIFES